MSQVKKNIDFYETENQPEGSWYKETYRSDTNTYSKGLGERSLMTSIYFLLESHQTSNFHVIKSDELWFYHSGSALTVDCTYPNGEYKTLRIGPESVSGQSFQALVPKGIFFGSTVDVKNSYSMVGCTASPDFDFNDPIAIGFNLFERQELLTKHIQHHSIINKLT